MRPERGNLRPRGNRNKAYLANHIIYSEGGKLKAVGRKPAAGSSRTKQSGGPCARSLEELLHGLLAAAILPGLTGHLAELPG